MAMRARVTPGFFPLLGQAQFDLVAETVVLRASLARECRSVGIEGRSFRVIGTVPDSFWFLDDRVEMWTLLPPERVNSWRLAGAVVRVDPGRVGEVQQRMRRVAWRTGFWPTGRDVEIAPLAPRASQPLRFYGWIWMAGVCGAGVWFLWRDRARRGAFCGVQFVLLTLGVALAVLEFTGASYVGMYGGAVFAGEPGAIWLFVLGWCGALWYAIADRRVRCRECLERLQLPARIGLPGNLLFGTAGTEMVCRRGHGALYVDEKPENVHEADRWIRLDESWRDLFARR